MSSSASAAPHVNLRQVGKPLARTDAPAKCYGTAIYAGDLTMPGMLYAGVLHSDRASARIKRIDTARAKALAGVHSVLTVEDLPVDGADRSGLLDAWRRFVGETWGRQEMKAPKGAAFLLRNSV